MSRRDQWRDIRDSIVGESKNESFEDRERMPEKACGVCENFSESAYSSAGRGSCRVLRMGSDLTRTPPVMVTEGENGMICFFNTDGAACTYFSRMKFIDTDGSECADPAFRRAHRQMDRTR
jgi:hypothetical protein